ncbi:gliding motility-associated C-terminal domain-containing protein [Cryomorphaceae bacterium 1068]|nr:gliding motility-associated C-terminal domain-containing protein [Cryomorphaceae bacterium 1068]
MRLGLLTYLILLTCWLPLLSLAQSQPTSLCADVNGAGGVQLSWVYSDAAPGTVYEIYRDQGVGFTGPLAPTVGFPDLTFNDVGAGANLNSIRYYVIDRDLPGSIPADTISTIFLELIPTGASSVAQLEWNFPFDPMPLGGEFIIERSEAGASFIAIATLPPSSDLYRDTLYSVCELTEFTYRVRYQQGACSMSSQEVSSEFEDDVGPPAPVVETISVDPVTGEVTIYWPPSSAPDIAGYIIQDADIPNNIFTEIDSIPGDNQSYTLNLSASSDPVTWVVLALDTCGNENSFDQPHTTMEVNVTFLDCSNFATIDWTPYEGWGDDLSGYEIRAILADGTDILLATAGPDGFISNVDVDPNLEYRFYIKAISSGLQQPSTSNGVLVFTEYPPIIDFHYLSSVSTNLEGQVEVNLYQDTTGVGTTYELFKKEEEGNYNFVGLFAAIPGEDTITYIDSDVRANELVYTYYWKAIDGCGEVIGDSNEGSNIVLETRTNKSNLVNRLNWTKYGVWDGAVVEYQILRGLGDEEPAFYDVTDPNTTEWSEDVEQFLTNQGRFCYRIQAVESTNQYGPGAVSFSNLSCVTQEPLVWVPSAMVYEGFNDQFKPVLGFIDFETYRMEIYNKWGELLFETSDIETGWDGTYSGSVVPEDYYRYIISFRDGGGKPFVEEGVMYMVRNAE